MGLFRAAGAVEDLLGQMNQYTPIEEGDVCFIATTADTGWSKIEVRKAPGGDTVSKYADEHVGDVVIPPLEHDGGVDVEPGQAAEWGADVLAEVAHRAAEALATDREVVARAA